MEIAERRATRAPHDREIGLHPGQQQQNVELVLAGFGDSYRLVLGQLPK